MFFLFLACALPVILTSASKSTNRFRYHELREPIRARKKWISVALANTKYAYRLFLNRGKNTNTAECEGQLVDH